MYVLVTRLDRTMTFHEFLWVVPSDFREFCLPLSDVSNSNYRMISMSLSLLPVIVLRKIATKAAEVAANTTVKVVERTVQVVRESTPEAAAGVALSAVSLAVGLAYM